MRQNCIKEKGKEEKGQKAEGVCERREGRDEEGGVERCRDCVGGVEA